MTALLLLGPATPMLFQGQEFAASAPFLYFADHEPRAGATRCARAAREFLAQFPSLADAEAQARARRPGATATTFERCKLDFAERERHARGLRAAPRPAARCAATTRCFARRGTRRRRRRGARRRARSCCASSARRRRRPAADRQPRPRPAISTPAPEPLLAPPAGLRMGACVVERGVALRRRRHAAARRPTASWRFPGKRRVLLRPGADARRTSSRRRWTLTRRRDPRDAGRRDAGERAARCAREWLVTNGLGGYASGTVAGVLTRRYHGLLIAALPAPLGRIVMLNHLLEQRAAAGRRRPSARRRGRRSARLERDGRRAPRRVPARAACRSGATTIDGVRAREARRCCRTCRTRCTSRYRLLEGDGPVRLDAAARRCTSAPHEAPVERRRSPSRTRSRAVGDRYEICRPGRTLPPLRLMLHGERAALHARRAADRRTCCTAIEESRGYEARGDAVEPRLLPR